MEGGMTLGDFLILTSVIIGFIAIYDRIGDAADKLMDQRWRVHEDELEKLTEIEATMSSLKWRDHVVTDRENSFWKRARDRSVAEDQSAEDAPE